MTSRGMPGPRRSPGDVASGLADPVRARPWWLRLRALWALAVVAAALDVALTARGVAAGLVEANPVAAWAMAGLGPLRAMVVLKAAALGLAAGATRLLPPPTRWPVPVVLAGVWLAAAALNAAAVAGV